MRPHQFCKGRSLIFSRKTWLHYVAVYEHVESVIMAPDPKPIDTRIVEISTTGANGEQRSFQRMPESVRDCGDLERAPESFQR